MELPEDQQALTTSFIKSEFEIVDEAFASSVLNVSISSASTFSCRQNTDMYVQTIDSQ